MEKRNRTIKHIESIIFIFIWTVFFLSPLIVGNINGSFEWELLKNTWYRFLPFLVFSIINHFILIPYLFFKRKLWYLISALSLLVLLGFTILTVTENKPKMPQHEAWNPENMDHPPAGQLNHGPQRQHRDPNERPQHNSTIPPPRNHRGMPPIFNSMLIAILVLGFDIGLRTTFKWTKTEQERNKLEKEKVKNELAFLRNQLSPHFFMNTLNNIHSLIDMDTEEAKDSIIRLSKLMRHLLYDSNDDLIPLSKEIQFIQSYVDLMKLRFTEKVKVTFTVDSDSTNISVPPLLFTSIIENAFKYGVSYKQNSFIHIVLKTTENVLEFTIKNSKNDNQAEKENCASGIGLENTRKRLNLLYASTYQLNINESEDTFSVQLKLPL